MATEPILTDAEVDEALYHFGNLLRLDTSNPPGNEAIASRYVAGVLATQDVPYHVVETAFNRTNLVARLGVGRPDEGVLVSAHMDVSPARSENWTHPPFDGCIEDGFVWGRGALDGKHMLTYGMMAMVLARRRGLRLTRDLAFAAVADREDGCRIGSLHLAQQRPELLQSRYCLTDGGGSSIDVNGRTLVPVGTATKGYALLRLTARGSLEAPNRLLSALSMLSSGLLEHRLCPAGLALLDAVARCLDLPQAMLVQALKFEGLESFGQRLLRDPSLSGLLAAATHDTVCVTRLACGDGTSEIPEVAEAWLDLRVLPGRPVTDVVHDLRQRLGPNVELSMIRSGEPTTSDVPTPLFQTIERHVKNTVPGSRVASSLTPHFTDAMAYQSLGITTYGFAPVIVLERGGLGGGVRASNEHISIDGFRRGLDLFMRVLFDFCTAD